MSDQKRVRVRFAPSPTGGLHLGGVRTVLFNYLFARHHQGDFILRIEDTDQTRYVEGAEQYILDCLSWCGLIPDERPQSGGEYGPYRQSERKHLYAQYAKQLIDNGHAYYAFDTPAELEQMRNSVANFRYDHSSRTQLRNSLTLSADEVSRLLEGDTPYVVRIKMPEDQVVSFTDAIRGEITFETSQVDDKVLLKADGMPTYHLAVVVDDYLMKITHAFRGEEWLPSAPVHLLLWEYLGWKDAMPQWAHLPLILKPDGHGKLSKRDGDRLGFPVYAMNWLDPRTGELTKGFRELGFLPQAFVNMLAMLGWNDGTDQEIFTLEELIEKFSLDRVSKAGAKFDFEKAKWFNAEWIKRLPVDELLPAVKNVLAQHNVTHTNDAYIEQVLRLVHDRLTFINDFWQQASFFFVAPQQYDLDAVKPRWSEQKTAYFNKLATCFEALQSWDAAGLETVFKELAAEDNLKTGEVMLPFRIMLVGGKFGPQVFDIAALLGKNKTLDRIAKALTLIRE
ncbi:glutamate--tRNA ligase (plasmid) [Pedobacter sp. BS3]|uniref:glutamate--tRNA ligase n=1 Tax=Pedobacter sp. BS3 TaxID=2567937 RepID=UPI0011ED385D|nr:glutamate--tRNA ligase [Pedobacter sp. BS3]TZF85874.1 glutamate--tRNA ligase [Pedobacter sp. BS3]